MAEPDKLWERGLPAACFEQIVLLGGPRAACRLTAVCKSYRAAFNDERLWSGYHNQFYGTSPLKYHSWRSSFLVHASAAGAWARGMAVHAITWPAVHDRWVSSIDVNPDYLLTGSVSSEAKMWDRQKRVWVHYLGGGATRGGAHSTSSGHMSAVTAVRFAGAKEALTGGRDGAVCVWDLTTGQNIRTHTLGDVGARHWVNAIDVYWPEPGLRPSKPNPQGSHPSTPHALQWHVPSHQAHSIHQPRQQGNYLAVCATSVGGLVLIDPRQHSANGVIASLQHGTPVGSLYSVSVCGHMLAAGCATGSAHLWDLRSRSHFRELPSHASAVTTVSLHAGGGLLVTGHLQGCLCTWLLPEFLEPEAAQAVADFTSSPACCSGQPQASRQGLHASDAAPTPAVVHGWQAQQRPQLSQPQLLGTKQLLAEWVRGVTVQGAVVAVCAKDAHVSLHGLPGAAAAALGVGPEHPAYLQHQQEAQGAGGRQLTDARSSDDEDDSWKLSRLRLAGDGPQPPQLQLVNCWPLGEDSAGAVEGVQASKGGVGDGGKLQNRVHAYALCSDEWSLFAGCTDCSVREWKFSAHQHHAQ